MYDTSRSWNNSTLLRKEPSHDAFLHPHISWLCRRLLSSTSMHGLQTGLKGWNDFFGITFWLQSSVTELHLQARFPLFCLRGIIEVFVSSFPLWKPANISRVLWQETAEQKRHKTHGVSGETMRWGRWVDSLKTGLCSRRDGNFTHSAFSSVIVPPD